MDFSEIEQLPGGDLIAAGLVDVVAGRETAASLLVEIGAPRLEALQMDLPSSLSVRRSADDDVWDLPEHRLYALLAAEDADSAQGRYNALIRRLVSFERAPVVGRLTTAAKLEEFLRELGRSCTTPGHVYLVGGATAVREGWRETTVNVDLELVPEHDEALRAIHRLKDELAVNVELASPDHFIPEVPGWRERSRLVGRYGPLTVSHYDPYSQVLAKLERSHAKDLRDASAMVRSGLVDAGRLLAMLAEIEPELYRYPALDGRTFRRSVERFVETIQAEDDGQDRAAD
ncbi:MAG: hypothetical protein DWQ36_02720 [Acidobacteria bacterium]|nr:MAG: hypothetical protein DWQ30_24110 [Acidobacteriota bacterium]REK11350.1 MAG: hypothetical protein DWQ36_02720 [Acidobacteriota bacterium]